MDSLARSLMSVTGPDRLPGFTKFSALHIFLCYGGCVRGTFECTELWYFPSACQPARSCHPISLLLKGAETNADDIRPHLSGFDAEQLWNVIHGVELARGVIDSLLADAARSN